MAINNPYIPGDPYSYDLKWIVAKVKEILAQLGTLDEAIEAKIFEGFLEHSIVQFKTVPEMLAAEITDGSIVLTLGYNEAGDQGGLFYLVKDFNPSQCSLDYFLTMDNNAQIAIPVIVTPYVTPEMFGAYGDGIQDDLDPIDHSLETGQPVILSAKSYKISGTIEVPAYGNISGVARSPFGSAGSIIIGDSTAPVLLTSSHVIIENLTIKDGSIGVLVNGARGYYHNISIQNTGDGIVIGRSAEWSSHNTFERVSIYDLTGTAILIENGNSQNSQDMSFYDVDIVMAANGVHTYQPGNRFYNLSVQNTKANGYGVIFEDGANNNAFYGTYLENEDALADVNFKTSRYNQFTGSRPAQYIHNAVNNDGTNTFEIVSIQNRSSRILLGSCSFEKVGVPLRVTNGQYSSIAYLQKHSDSTLKLAKNGDDGDVYFISDLIYNEPYIPHNGAVANSRFTNLTVCTLNKTFSSLPAGGSNGVNVGDLPVDNVMAIANCTTGGVWCNCVPQVGGFRLIAHNTTANDLSGVALTFVLLLATKPA